MNLIDTLAKKLSRKAVLIDKQQIAQHTYHLKIQGADLNALPYIPGEHLRVLVGVDKPTALSEKVRTYSVWQYDPGKALMDLAVCTFSTGIGARWVQDVSVGETLYFSGPKGNFTANASGDYYLLVGDISALAHLYEIRRHLPITANVSGLVYAENETDFFPDLDGRQPFNFYQMPPNPTDQILQKLQPMLAQQAGKGMLYVGGDSRVCVSLNRHFRQNLQWKPAQIKTKPFWNPDKTGLE